MRNTFKKSFAILLVVCMLLASVPFTASAVATEAATLAELQSALASGADVINVTANIELTAAITVNGKATITSTNGSSILRAASYKSYMFVVANGGELTLEDITVNGNRTNYETAQLATEMIVVQGGGVLNFNDGAVLTTNRGNAEVSGGGITVVGTLNINGGTITNIHMHNSSSVTVQYGAAVTVAGGTVNMYGGTITANDGRNGAIGVVSGTYNMYGGAIDGNVANEQGGGAGGVHISAAGTFNMENGSVINNSSRRNGGAFYNQGTLNISGGIISGNTATYTDKTDPTIFFGGGVYNTGVLNITGGEISGNTAKSCGGAVYNLGTMTLSGGTIDNNASQMYSAGAIFVDGTGTLTVSGGFITNNKAGQYGGAIAVTSSASKALVITGGAFSGNSCGANQCGGDIYITTANTSNVNTAYSYECKTYTLFVDNVGSRYSASNAKPATSNVLTAGYGYVFAENGEGHKYGDWTVTLNPTCTDKGSQERTCPNCNKVETQPIAALGHSWNAGKVLTAAKCTTPGEKLYTCTVCNETKTEVVPSLGHKAGTITTIDPTCTTAGTKSYKCTACGETITETIAALGHKPTTTTVNATCTDDGYVSVTCTRCDEELSHSILVALGHKDGEWVVTKQATRQETGIKELKCAVCGETISTEVIPLIPDPTVTVATVEAEQDAPVVKVPVTFVGNDGIWSMGFYVYYDASLDLNGVLAGDIFERIIDSNYNVNPATDARAAAAFAAAGVSTEGVLCYRVYAEALDLNNIKVDGTVVTLVFDLPNNDTYEFVVGIVPVEGLTINNEGVELEYYTNDGAIVIPALDPCEHVPGEWVETVAPTCTATGTKVQNCVNCGKLMNTASIPAKGHSWGTAVETKAPTCTATGVATATCGNCDATKTSTIPAKGHSWGAAVETTAPTCTVAGVATAICGNCDATKTSPIPATGHNAGEWVEEIAPGATTEGLRTKRCTVCGELIASETIPPTEVSKITVSSVEAEGDATATVDVALEYNPGVWGMLVYVYYDEALELTGITAGDVFAADCITYDEAVFNSAPEYLDDCLVAFEECGVSAAGKKVTAVYLESADLADVTADGIIFKATFNTPATIDVAYEVGVVYSAENVFDAEYNNIDLVKVSGEVVIRESVCAHDWSNWAVDNEGNCTTAKVETRSCSLCGKNETKTTPAPGHAWGEATVVEPTCTEAGSSTISCSSCGEEVVEILSAPGHTAGSWVIDGDKMTQSCTVCGVLLAEKEIGSIPTITVDTVNVVTGNTATVPVYLTGNDGIWATRLFIYYDAALTLTGVANGEIAANSELTVGELNQAVGSFAAADEAFAECGVDATGMKFVCVYIEADALADILGNGTLVTLEFAAINATGTYEIGVAALKEDCFNNEEVEIEYTFEAGAVEVAEKPVCAHVVGDWTITTAATATEAGEKVLTCTKCGEVILTMAIPATNDVIVYATDVEAAPGEGFTTQVIIKNNPGIWGSRVIAVYDEDLTMVGIESGDLFAGDSEFEASEEFTDPMSNNTLKRIFEANGMSADGKKAVILWFESNDLVDQEGDGVLGSLTFAGATAGVYGLNFICDLPYDTFDIEANDIAVSFEGAAIKIVEAEETCTHAKTTVVGAVDATCTEEGYTGDAVCDVCGEIVVKGEGIPALGHVEGAWIVTKQPTTTATGLKELKCSKCGETIRTEVIDKLTTDVVLGDIDGNGRINASDVKLLKQYVARAISADEIVLENADLDGNGRINASDVKLLKQYVARAISADDLG